MINFLMDHVLSGPEIERIADAIMEYQRKEQDSSPLRAMEQDLRSVERKITNINNAIADGIWNSSTSVVLSGLEETAANLRRSIESRKYAEGKLMDRDFVLFFLTKFSTMNRLDQHDRKILINVFLNSVYVYDDHFRIFVNTSDTDVIIPFSDLPPDCSDSVSVGLPVQIHPNTLIIQYVVRV